MQPKKALHQNRATRSNEAVSGERIAAASEGAGQENVFFDYRGELGLEVFREGGVKEGRGGGAKDGRSAGKLT